MWFESDELQNEKMGKGIPTPPHNCDGIACFLKENHIKQVQKKGKEWGQGEKLTSGSTTFEPLR